MSEATNENGTNEKGSSPTPTERLEARARRQARTALGAILVLGLAVRIFYALQPHAAFGDEACYITLGKNLFGGEGYTYYNGTTEVHFPPLFPIAIGILGTILGNWEIVTRILYILCGTLLILPVYALARAIHSTRVALPAAFLTAILPAFTSGVLFAETLGEPLYLLCLISGVYAAHQAGVRGGWLRHAAAGALLCLAYLTRPEGLLVAAGVFLFLAILPFLRRPADGRSAARGAAVFAASFLVIASPYVIFLHHHTGQWSLSTKDTTTYVTTRGLVHHDGIAFQRDTWGLTESGEVRYFAHDFSKSLGGLLLGPYRHRVFSDIRGNIRNLESILFRPWVFGPILVPIMILGLFAAPWSLARFRAELLLLFTMLPLLAMLVFFVNERFVYGWLPILAIETAVGLETILEWFRRSHFPGPLARRGVRSLAQFGVVAALAAYLVSESHEYLRKRSEFQSEVFAAADWVRKNTPEGSTIMTVGPEVAFHSGRRWLPVPVASREAVAAYGKARGASYLLIRGRYIPLRPEQKLELFDGARDFPEMELAEKRLDAEGTPVFVAYRLR